MLLEYKFEHVVLVPWMNARFWLGPGGCMNKGWVRLPSPHPVCTNISHHLFSGRFRQGRWLLVVYSIEVWLAFLIQTQSYAHGFWWVNAVAGAGGAWLQQNAPIMRIFSVLRMAELMMAGPACAGVVGMTPST